jgi:hypothetical protein
MFRRFTVCSAGLIRIALIISVTQDRVKWVDILNLMSALD